jgi:hypothetical protein
MAAVILLLTGNKSYKYEVASSGKVFIRSVMKILELTQIIEESPSYHLATKLYPTFFWPS